jgi:hypothetical protein
MREIEYTMTVLWLMLGLGLILSGTLMAILLGSISEINIFNIFCIIGMAYVFFDIGKVFIMRPPSKI